MKKLNQKRNRKLRWLAFDIMAIITVICFISAPKTTVAMAIIAPITIGATTLEGKDAEMYTALKSLIEGEKDKYAKGYISEEKCKSLVSDHIKESLETYFKENGQMKIEFINGLQKQLDDLGIALKALQEPGGKTRIKELGEMLGENKEAIFAAIKAGRPFEMNVKSDVLRTGVSGSTIAYRLPDVGQLPFQKTSLTNVFRHVNIGAGSNGTVRYIDQSSITRNADMKAESVQYPESAISWQEYTLTLQKIADSIPVSDEALMDLLFIEGEIRRLLEVNLSIKENNQLANGSGNAPEIKGITEYAQTFNGSTYSGFKPMQANIYDLIKIMAVQVMTGRESKYRVDTAFINPLDTVQGILAKNELGFYVMPPFVVTTPEGEIQVAGIKVIEDPSITANTITVGDSKWATIYDVEGFTIQIGYVDKQFIEGMRTLRAQKREALLVRNADANAFLKSTDIAGDLVKITAPQA